MATRENQGLFIAVILLVLLTVVLSVTTFFGFSGQFEAKDQSNSLRAQLDTARKEKDAYQSQAGILQALLGVGTFGISEIPTFENQLIASGNAELATETTTIRDTHNTDMAKIATTEDGTDMTYRQALDAMRATAVSAQNSVVTLNNDLQDQKLKLETEIAAKDKELAELNTLLVNARSELANEQQRHELTRTTLNTELNDVRTQFEQSESNLNQAQSALVNAQESHATQLEDRDAKIIANRAIIASLTERETDLADGKIVSVSPSQGKVTINLGANDNLRLNQTFAVYDREITTFRAGLGKATLEVTRIIDGGLAECRISSSSPTNPLLIGDQIATSTWDPGYSVPVAVAGRIQLDGDGRTDLQRLISIIRRAGGTVVAYHDDEGQVTGEIDENTRFFVVGDNALNKGRQGFDILEKQRQQFQTRVISVQEFLREMGVQSEGKIRSFERETPSDFKERQPGTTVEDGDAFGGGAAGSGSR